MRLAFGIAMSATLATVLIGAPAHAGVAPTAGGGATLLADVLPGKRTSDPRQLTVVGGTLYFTAQDPEHGRELWRSDGTASGARLVADSTPGPAGSDPQELTAVSEALFFSADDPEHGRELWVSDGSGEGTRLAASTNSR